MSKVGILKATGKALIFGVTGQDGSYLAEQLLAEGWEVVGVKRRSSTVTTERLKNVMNHGRFSMVDGNIVDASFVAGVLAKFTPDHIYNLAAQSFVGTSFAEPSYTFEVDTIGVINILEAMRQNSQLSKTRMFQASTSEMFGRNFTQHADYVDVKYQDENTAFEPQSPYAVAKIASHHMVQLYRRAYGLHASTAIMFNHESPRRGVEFVTRKITTYLKYLMDIVGNDIHDETSLLVDGSTDRSFRYKGKDYTKLGLGNMDAYRDWGFAGDYMKGAKMILDYDTPDDFVMSTGETHSVREFCEAAFGAFDLDYTNWVYLDKRFARPAEVDYLRGSSIKMRTVLGWEPECDFADLVAMMVRGEFTNG